MGYAVVQVMNLEQLTEVRATFLDLPQSMGVCLQLLLSGPSRLTLTKVQIEDDVATNHQNGRIGEPGLARPLTVSIVSAGSALRRESGSPTPHPEQPEEIQVSSSVRRSTADGSPRLSHQSQRANVRGDSELFTQDVHEWRLKV